MSRFIRKKDVKNKQLPASTSNSGNKSNGIKTLTENEKIFADEWLFNRNGTRAYMKAFKNCKSYQCAATEAHNLLKKPKVKAYIAKRLDRISKKAEMNVEWVLNQYRKLIDFDLGEVFNDDGSLKPISEMSENAKFAAVSIKALKNKKVSFFKTGVKKEITQSDLADLRFHDKKLVLDKLGEYLGMFSKEGTPFDGQLNFNAPVQINVKLADD